MLTDWSRRLWSFAVARKLQGCLLLAACCLAVFAGMRWMHYAQGHDEVHISLGPGGQRNAQLQSVLIAECAHQGLPLVIKPVSGSEAALQGIVDDHIDLAVVRGCVGHDHPTLRQVCTGVCEVLHLFVRDEHAATLTAADAIRGKRVFLGTPGSETQALANTVLEFMRCQPGIDFEVATLDLSQLGSLPTNTLPDAIFEVSAVPSSIGEVLARTHGYRLVSLPFGQAMHLRERTLDSITIPPYTYAAEPPVPAAPLETVGCRTIIVASDRVSTAAVSTMLAVLFESDFARHAGLPQWDPSLNSTALEFPLHPGTTAYLAKDRPLIRADVLEKFADMRDAAASTGCALLLFWGWYRRRKVPRLEGYLLQLAEIELAALRKHRVGNLTPADLQVWREQLWLLKREMLEHYTTHRGKMENELVAALARVRDVDGSLVKLLRPIEQDEAPTTQRLRISA